jgi:hypothetical protein
MTEYKLNLIKKKYPFLFRVGKDIMDFRDISMYLQITKMCDIDTIKMLGLETYREDLKWILGNDIKFERREKLRKLDSLE